MGNWGIVMKIGTICLAALGVVAISSSASADCSLKKLTSADLLGRPELSSIVAVAINGTKENFVVDPSIAATALHADAASLLNLQVERRDNVGHIYSVQGNDLDRWTHVTKLAIGDLELDAPWLSVRPSTDSAIAGVIGANVLRKFDVEFDFAAGKLNFYSSDHCGGAPSTIFAGRADVIPFKLDNQYRVVVPIQLDGKDIRAVISTGAPNSLLDATLAYELFNLDEHSPGVMPNPYAATKSAIPYCYPFNRLSLGQFAVDHPLVCVENGLGEHRATTDAGKLAGDPKYSPISSTIVFHLGMYVLRHAHLYIAYGEEKLYVAPSEPAAK